MIDKSILIIIIFILFYGVEPDNFNSLFKVEDFAGIAWAETGENQSEADLKPGKKTVVDSTHKMISKSIMVTAGWLDSFFDNKRALSEENTSKVWLKLRLFAEKDQSIEFKPRVSARIVLPKAEDKLHIIIAGDRDEKSDTSISGEGWPGADFVSTGEDNVVTALWYFLKSTKKNNISIRTGVRFSGFEPNFYIGPRYRYTFKSDPLLIRFVQNFRWYSLYGWESRTYLDFDRQVYEKYLFRTTLGGSWFENQNGYFYNLSFNLYQPLKFTKALQYEWSNNFETRPANRLTSVILGARYRQNLLRDWIFFEVEPLVRFPRTKDFEATPGIRLELEIVFGGWRY